MGAFSLIVFGISLLVTIIFFGFWGDLARRDTLTDSQKKDKPLYGTIAALAFVATVITGFIAAWKSEKDMPTGPSYTDIGTESGASPAQPQAGGLPRCSDYYTHSSFHLE